MKSQFKLPLAGAVLLLCVVIAIAFLFWRAKSKRPEIQTANRIHISYSYTIQNASSLPVKNVELILPAPLLNESYQHCLNLQPNYPNIVNGDENGRQTLVFSWNIFPPLTTKVVTIQSDIQLHHSPKKTQLEKTDQYLQAEPFIESDDTAIMELASRFQSKKTIDKARSIYEWVAENIHYNGYIRQWRGARYALNHRKGDCSEYASLFVAVCRAGGIPARVMGGFICPASMVLELGDYHNWAEFYVDGYWQIADPQNRSFMPTSADYLAFQIVQPSIGALDIIRPKVQGKQMKVKLNS